MLAILVIATDLLTIPSSNQVDMRIEVMKYHDRIGGSTFLLQLIL
jgi:hypothetical protein